MRGFILVTFGFLAFAFYELSGGADYQPVSNSFQARTADKVARPESVEVVVLEAPAPEVEPVDIAQMVSRSTSDLSALAATEEPREDPNRFKIVLASVETKENGQEAAGLAPEGAERSEAVTSEQDLPGQAATREVFSLETYTGAITASDGSGFGIAAASTDLRIVSGNRVNMRTGPGQEFQPVMQLTKGTEIAVLDDPGNGWIMLEVLETGETGWMADWLVTSSN